MRFKNSYNETVKKYIKENNLTYAINTMGCALNENDSAKYRGILEAMGFKRATEESDANFILFNTCCIRENAENTLFGRLGFFKKKKQENNNVYIAVVGCMTQQQHIIDKIKKSYRYVDIILGTSNIDSFPQKIYNVIINKVKSLEYQSINEDIVEDLPIIYTDDKKASVSIIYGCNNFCTYCIVPYVRGRERSRAEEDILNDIQNLAKRGYKEITLLGQNVNSYGKDLNNGESFAKLLKKVEKVDGIEIIRFMSPHPKDFSDDLIDVISKSSKISKQIHLPLQSGSTAILKKMNRKYTKDEYLNLAKKIKEKIEGVSFTTDIIVGFPTETEEDFEDTLDVVRRVEYDQIFMFIYSKRKGTKAELMEDNTKNKVKVERLEKLKNLHEQILYKNNDEMIGKIVKILVEGKSRTNSEYYTGRTNTNKIVNFKSSKEQIGNFVNVRIIENCLWYLKGEITSN